MSKIMLCNISLYSSVDRCLCLTVDVFRCPFGSMTGVRVISSWVLCLSIRM